MFRNIEEDFVDDEEDEWTCEEALVMKGKPCGDCEEGFCDCHASRIYSL